MEIFFERETTDGLLTPALEDLLKRAIELVLVEEGFHTEGEVSVSLVDKERIRALNAGFRQKDQVTDVLSFPQYVNLLEDEEIDDYLVLGDIVLCVEQAKEQAEEFGHSLERELAYLTVHSMYHLLGLDHQQAEEKSFMRQKEEAIMTQLSMSRR